MSAASRRPFTAPTLTEETTSAQAHVCRVCTLEIPAGESLLYRAWGVEYSHVACNWIRDDEVEPHQRMRPGTFTAPYWEWRCPSCKRDACSSREPDEASERRCGRCAPEQYTIALGARVELVSSLVIIRKHRRVKVERGARAHVREIRAAADSHVVRVLWIGAPRGESWLPVRTLVRV